MVAQKSAEGQAASSVSRRSFLAATASLAGSACLPGASAKEPNKPLLIPPGAAPARVVRVRAAGVLNDSDVHRQILREMLDAALAGLFPETETPEQAWKSVLEANDIIGLKFNQSGQGNIGTTATMADVLITSLLAAGFSATQIVCLEAPEAVTSRFGTLHPRPGYGRSTIDFGSGADRFSAVLGQITAIINIPFLKTHNIAGMTGALKNLSHGLIKHPARYHANGCSPFIADIVGSEAIRPKLRLTIVDALRVVYKDGPSASVENIAGEGLLLASQDPVAVDAVGLETINAIRAKRGLDAIVAEGETLPYLEVAHRAGLGIAALQGIGVSNVIV